MDNVLEKTYELAQEIQNLAPWNAFEDVDIIYFHFMDNTDVFASIMGNAQKVYGVAFYEGEEGLGSLLDIMNGPEDSLHQTKYTAIGMTNLTVYYDTVQDIKNGPFEKMLDDRYKDLKGKVPYFVRMKKQYVPYLVEGDDLERLYRYLRTLKLALEEVNEEGYSCQEETEMMSIDVDDEDPKDISTFLYTMPRPVMSTRYFDLELPEKEIDKIFSKAKRNEHLLIVDCDYTGPFDDPNTPRGFFADVLFLIQEDGSICGFEILGLHDNKINSLTNRLCAYVKENGIPKYIATRKSDLEFLLAKVAEQYGIQRVDINWNLVDEQLDDFWTGLQSFKMPFMDS